MIRRESKDNRIRIRPHFVMIPVSPDRVLIRSGLWSGQSYMLEDQAKQGLLSSVMEQLSRGVSMADLSDSVGRARRADVDDLVEQLLSQCLAEQIPEDQLTPSRAQGIAMVSGFSPLPAETRLEALEEWTVAIWGLGRTARRVARQLAATGVGQLLLVPASENEDATALQRSCADEGPDCRTSVVGTDDMVTLMTDSQRKLHLVVALDAPELSRLREANRLCLEHGTCWTSAVVDGLELLIGPTFIPGQSACYNCFELRLEGNIVEYEAYREHRDYLVGKVGCKGHGHPPAVHDLAAGYLGYDLFRLLTLNHGFTQGRVIRINLGYGGIELNDVLRLPRCPSCGKPARSRPGNALFYTLDNVIRELDV